MPKLFITVKPNAKKEEVVALDATHLRIAVKAPPDEGRANEAVIEALRAHYRLPKSCFTILSGHKSKNKIISMNA